MRKKIIASDITVAMVIDAYRGHGFDRLSRLFGADKNGKIRVTKNRKCRNGSVTLHINRIKDAGLRSMRVKYKKENSL